MQRSIVILLGLAIIPTQPIFALETKSTVVVEPVAEATDPTATQWTLEKLENPPPREIKFERLETELEKKLIHPDPKLLEQKYVATVRLERRKAWKNFVGDKLSFEQFGIERKTALLPYLKDVELFGRGGGLAKPEKLFKGFERLMQQIPEDRRDKVKETWEFFASARVDEGYVVVEVAFSGESPESRTFFTQLRVLASTPEIAEQRAVALLYLLDQGVSRPIEMELFKRREIIAAEWRTNQQSLSAADTKFSELNKQLSTYADYTGDMLTGLRLQNLQLEVDLARAKARLATCEALLKREPLPPSIRESMAHEKLKTEIDIAGIEAGQAKSQDLITQVKAKSALLSQIDTVTRERTSLRRDEEDRRSLLVYLDAEIGMYAPLPLVDGKVIVQPVKWTP